MIKEETKPDVSRRVVLHQREFGFFTLEVGVLVAHFPNHTIRFGVFAFGWPSRKGDPYFQSLN
jgi:hypothetical protein